MRYAVTILIWATLMRPAAAQLDAVFASWSERYNELSSVEYVLDGKVITTPDFVIGLGTPTQKLTDDPLPVHIHAKIDFKGGRAWIRRDEYQWQAQQQRFERRITETILNGERTQIARISPKTQKRTVRVYENARRSTLNLQRIDLLPMWLNSGILAVGEHRSSFSLPNHTAEIERWTVTPDDPQKSGGRLDLLASYSPLRYAVAVDTKTHNAIVRLEGQDSEGRLTFEMRLQYGDYDGANIARQWETAVYGGGRNLRIWEKIEVTRFSKRPIFADDNFTITPIDDD